MILTQNYNIEIQEGSSFSKVYLCKDSSMGLPVDITGCVVEMQIKFEYSASPVVYRSDVSTNVILGGTLGTIKVSIPWLDIFNIDSGITSYSLYLTYPSGITVVPVKGFVTIVRSGAYVNIPGVASVNEDVPLVVGGPIRGPLTSEESQSIVLATDHKAISVTSIAGIGTLALVPNGTINGTPLGILPIGAVGVRLYLGASDSVTFTISGSIPSTAPQCTFTLSASTTGPNWDENLSSGQMLYITNTTGSPKFRWI